MKRAVALALVVVLAGCPAVNTPTADGGGPATTPTEDRLGWENGYWYNSTIDVDASDGLSEREMDAVVARTMARLEHLRGLEFEKTVPVEVITRSEYRQRNVFETNATHSTWNNQVWEGLFLVGEDRNISEVFEEAYGASVAGYYSPPKDKIVVVSDSAEPTVDRGTLVHELVHALQDQQFGLTATPPTQDGQLARNAVVEGEASILTRRYNERCGAEWSCIEPQPSFGGSGNIDQDVFSVIIYPYVAGPGFVQTIRQRGSWDAVDALYDDYPASTEQVTTPSLYPDDEPVAVTVPDRSNGAWDRFDHDPVGDTLGQASIQTMLDAHGAGRSGYVGPATEGWEGDTLVPYQNGDRYGYVWELAWDSPAEARDFRAAYQEVLNSQGARKKGNGVYVIPEWDNFGDAFRVTVEGNRVRIVNAPTVEALDAVHAG